jgi:hypothetical protein
MFEKKRFMKLPGIGRGKNLEMEYMNFFKWNQNWKYAWKVDFMNLSLGIDMSMISPANDMSWIWPTIIVYQCKHV